MSQDRDKGSFRLASTPLGGRLTTQLRTPRPPNSPLAPIRLEFSGGDANLLLELLAKGIRVAITKLCGDLLERHITIQHHGFSGVDAQLDTILLKRTSEDAAKLLSK